MSPEELSRAQIRMTAMHAAITLYCCHRGGGVGSGDDIGQIIGQFAELKEQLIQLRDQLLETALVAGPI